MQLYKWSYKFVYVCAFILKLRHKNIYDINVSWGRKGLSPKHNRSHQFYTERLCSHFLRIVMAAFTR